MHRGKNRSAWLPSTWCLVDLKNVLSLPGGLLTAGRRKSRPPCTMHLWRALLFDNIRRCTLWGLHLYVFLCSIHQTAQLFRLWRTAGEAGVIFPPSCSDTSSICLLRLFVLRLAGGESPLADDWKGPSVGNLPWGPGCASRCVWAALVACSHVSYLFSVFELRCCSLLVPV